MRVKKEIDEKALVCDYVSGMGLNDLCSKYSIGKIRAKEIIVSSGENIRAQSSFKKYHDLKITDWSIKKYPDEKGFHYIARYKTDGKEFNDYMNQGGFLTSYIKEKEGIEVPSLYDRRIYYQKTGNYWWEQWFDILKVSDAPIKKCPYCDWETTDIENKSGAFEQHLQKIHGISILEYLNEYPNDAAYFKKHIANIERNYRLKDEKEYVICPICGIKLYKMTLSHIQSHGITYEQFKETYPDFEFLSDVMSKQTAEAMKLGNLSVSKSRFISKYERELQEFLKTNNISFETNRQILIGQEIDILINDKKLGIEFDGLKWHTEWFGKKKHDYHLNKTLKCNEKGYGLIHIFEDEYVAHKEIVLEKISHALGLHMNLPSIMGRKLICRPIYKHDAEIFLNNNHIQGFVSATVYLGGFYNNELVAVMSFKNGNIKNPDWELVRYVTSPKYKYQGVASKMFSYFKKTYNPERVVSFADRRWTINALDNMYIKLGFELVSYNRPDYRYYKDSSKDGQKFERIHKMTLNKQKLHKKYGFPLTMTETEMAKELGYDRIWDCGLIKYVWENKER